MKSEKWEFLSGSALWFGAAVSIAEILTGALLAPLGLVKGFIAILLGHIFGGVLFFLAGIIGAKETKSAMDSVSLSFGRYASVFFAVINVLQLVGWTAVMILNGSVALEQASGTIAGGIPVYCAIIAVIIIVWILLGVKNVSKLNIAAVSALLILTIVLAFKVFSGGGEAGAAVLGTMSFGMALELSVTMPVSWLPLVADYTKDAKKPFSFTLAGSLTYFVGSVFMYTIGLAAAVNFGSGDIVAILVNSGLGIAAVVIVVLSTVTTTFLDVFSAGESMKSIYAKVNPKLAAIVVCIIGMLIAAFATFQYENFLYLISSVFVPMATVLIVDRLILKNKQPVKNLDIKNFALWLAGFALYRFFMYMDMSIGSTIPVIIIISLAGVLVNIINKKIRGGK